MKAKDFFTQLRSQGKISDSKFDAFVEGTPDFDVPDEFIGAFENNFLTIDRARADSRVNGYVRSQVLDPIDNYLNQIISAIEGNDSATADELKSLIRTGSDGKPIPDTYKRIDALSRKLPGVFDKVKVAPADEDFKKKLKQKEDQLFEMADRVKLLEKSNKEGQESLKLEFENKLHDYRLDSELSNLTNKFTLAEAYDKNRPALNKFLMSQLKGSNKLQLREKDGQSEIVVIGDNGEPKFNGNSPVTINSLLEDTFSPYLKQSNGDGQKPDNTSSQKRTIVVDAQKPARRQGVDTTVGRRQ